MPLTLEINLIVTKIGEQTQSQNTKLEDRRMAIPVETGIGTNPCQRQRGKSSPLIPYRGKQEEVACIAHENTSLSHRFAELPNNVVKEAQFPTLEASFEMEFTYGANACERRSVPDL